MKNEVIFYFKLSPNPRCSWFGNNHYLNELIQINISGTVFVKFCKIFRKAFTLIEDFWIDC